MTARRSLAPRPRRCGRRRVDAHGRAGEDAVATPWCLASRSRGCGSAAAGRGSNDDGGDAREWEEEGGASVSESNGFLSAKQSGPFF